MFTTEEIAKAVGGRLAGGNAEVSCVSTDTRSIAPGALFIAVKGESFDGNDYLEKAFENGAEAVMTEKKTLGFEPKKPVIFVENTRAAQLSLARYYRDKFKLKLCGVTGSVGKTSTKDMVYAVLSAKYKTLRTEGNFNNDIGLPRTLFGLDDSFRAAVIEMGMSDLGEISALSKAAHPNAAIITNIGFCHIENLKSQENILKAKLEILDGADADAPLILCGEDELLNTVKLDRKIIRYGFSEKNDVSADGISESEDGASFTLHYDGKAYPARVPVIGSHHVLNALAAFCAGISFGLTPEEIVPAFMNYAASGMRQKIEKRGDITVILDCYNASPTSMESSLGVLGKMNGRKIAVLGDMLELGEMSKRLHAGLADAVCKNADLCFLYGSEMKALRDELFRREFPVFHSENKSELTGLLLQNIKSGDAVLFKGSRGMKMEEIAGKVGKI